LTAARVLSTAHPDHTLQNFHTIKVGNTNCYLIRGGTGAALVDTGGPGRTERILDSMNSAGVEKGELKLIVVTHAHYDHLGSAIGLARMTGAKIALHAADQALAESGRSTVPKAEGAGGKTVRFLFRLLSPLASFEAVMADVLLEDGESLAQFGVDASVYHTPGHTNGSITVVAARRAFVGDLIVNRKGPVEHPFADSRERLRDSITRLRRLGLETIYPAHGEPFSADELKHVGAGKVRPWWWMP